MDTTEDDSSDYEEQENCENSVNSFYQQLLQSKILVENKYSRLLQAVEKLVPLLGVSVNQVLENGNSLTSAVGDLLGEKVALENQVARLDSELKSLKVHMFHSSPIYTCAIHSLVALKYGFSTTPCIIAPPCVACTSYTMMAIWHTIDSPTIEKPLHKIIHMQLL